MAPPRGINLNDLSPRSHGGYDWTARARGTTAGGVTVHFGDVASSVEAFIRDSPMIVGCVAWVKSKRLITALAARPVALVVNKEFGLRVQGHPEREALMPLVGGVPTSALPAPTPAGPTVGPVRCVGWTAKGRFGALMHHKFLVRLDAAGRAVAVWTGSFNLTAGAESNIENGMTIHDAAIAQAFLEEFTRVWALSEPLLFSAGTPTPGSNANVAVKVPTPRRKPSAKRKPASKKATARKPAAKKTAPAKKATATRKPATMKPATPRAAAAKKRGAK